MKKRKMLTVAAAIMCCIVTGCTDHSPKVTPMSGTIEEAFGLESASKEVQEAMASGTLDVRYENVCHDATARVAVWSLMRLDDERSSEGMGVMVVKDDKATAFPDIRHGNQPSARYDAKTQTLRLAMGEMEGTGAYVERLYLLRFADDGTASIAQSIDPYDMQQALLQRLGYSIDGQSISFYDKKRLLCTVTDTVSDMGGFDEDPIWIGEQLRYDISGETVRVLCTPGLKYVTGLVLNYDAMPTISADVELSPEASFDIKNISVKE